MLEPDAIIVAAFDDEGLPLPCTARSDTRPTGQPRPESSKDSRTDAIATMLVDSDTESSSIPQPAIPALPALAFDICLFDQKVNSFLVIYSAGTPLSGLRPRTVLIPAAEADAPVMSLVAYKRSRSDERSVPYRTFHFSQDIRGARLTFRFTDPLNPQSLLVERADREFPSEASRAP